MTEAVAPPVVYHFRCNTCNSLETGDHAGERDIPLKCRTCGKGAHYIIDDNGAPRLVSEPENWTVLADLDGDGIDDVISYHGQIEIGRHSPFKAAALTDEHGALMRDEAGTVMMTTLERSGPEVEPEAPKHVQVITAESVGNLDDVIGKVNS